MRVCERGRECPQYKSLFRPERVRVMPADDLKSTTLSCEKPLTVKIFLLFSIFIKKMTLVQKANKSGN